MCIAVSVYMFCIYLYIIFLSIFCIVCVLGFPNVQRLVNLCCVFMFIAALLLLCFGYVCCVLDVFYGFDKRIVFLICALYSNMCDLMF